MDYLTEVTPAVMKFFYIRRRQFGIDVYMVGHGLRQLPPKCFSYASWLILFDSSENFIERKKELLKDTFDKILKAQARISKKVEAGNPYYYEIILLDTQIRGSYVAQNKL